MKSFLTLIITIISLPLLAQPNGEIMERIKARKIGFITQKLDLSASEAQKFWPIYNEYEAQRMELGKSLNELDRNVDNGKTSGVLDQYTSLRKKEYELEAKYLQSLKSTLPEEKIIKLIVLEREFKAELVNKVKKHMRERRGSID